MIYLDPRSDVAFKKLFGDITHKNVIISFLNSVLKRTEGQKIVDVVMNDPNNIPETVISKASIVDIRCTDQNNHQYIVEMQVISQKDYAARAQYYSSLALSRQLAIGHKYERLVPVVFVGILDFKLFKSEHYVSHHFILDTQTYEHELKHLEFHFIELEKFEKGLDDLTNILDKWIYFLKNAGSMQKVPAILKDPALQEAFDILEQSNWSAKELAAYDQYLDAMRSSMSQLETAEEMGRAQGKQEGVEEGRRAEKIELAKNLLSYHDVATIVKLTGLSIAEVENLKDKN